MTITISNNQSPLTELFSLPFNSKPVANFGGEKLYSSDELPNKYLEAMSKQDKTKPIIDTLEELVGKGLIVPCWMSKGVFNLLKHKVFGGSNKHIMGFYSPQFHKIYLLMDNNITFGFASDKVLANLTLHEGCHMASATMKSSFISTFKSELTSYYSQMFQSMFGFNNSINPKDIKVVYEFLFKKFEHDESGSVLGFLKQYNEVLHRTMAKYSSDRSQFEMILKDLITFIAIYLKGDVGPLIQAIPSYQHIFKPLYAGYKDGLGAKDIDTICIQELLIPSEVICIYSEFSKKLSSVHSAFKKIK